jgi:drug/metabolite transporter (DMT)-like permease
MIQFLGVILGASALAVWLRGRLGLRTFLAVWLAIVGAGLLTMTRAYFNVDVHDHPLGMQLSSWGLMLLGVGLGALVFGTATPRVTLARRSVETLAASGLGFASFFVGFMASMYLR